MIIGPNGTGKSTLVCAICLGLGFSPSCLGRAKEVGEFVKHGHQNAEIEVELKASPRQRGGNPIIRRVIKRDGNKSIWYINGSQATQKEVLQLVHSFYIQIDNLCQFLPQDRVVEFAAMTPTQLLESTQKAAAPPQVVECHERLKDLGKKRVERLNEQKTSKENLQQLQSKQSQTRAEVDRMTERQNLVAKVKTLEKVEAPLKFQIQSARTRQAKERRKEAQNEMRQLQNELRPALQKVQEKEGYKNRVYQVVEERKKMVERLNVGANNTKKELDKFTDNFKERDSALEAEKKANVDRKAKITHLDRSIRKLENQLQEEPPHFDVKVFQQRSNEKQREISALMSRGAEVKQTLETCQREVAERDATIDHARNEIKDLQTQAGKKMNMLKRVSSEAHRAWDWIRNHRNVFEGPVFGPPMVECSLKDQRYADALESICRFSDLIAFTVTTHTDFVRLQEILNSVAGRRLEDKAAKGITGVEGLQGLGIPGMHIRLVNRDLDHFQPPLTKDQLRECDLDDWAVNILEGPRPVLAMLCDNCQIQRTAITLRSHNPQQYEKIRDSPISSWVASGELNQVVRRREYGPSAVSTGVTPLKPARFWNSGDGVDAGAERDLKRKISELQSERDELLAQLAAAQKTWDEMRQEALSLKDEKVNYPR
jgi:structural maintenance of chromosomes protein 5